MKEIKLFTREGKQTTLNQQQFEQLAYSTDSYQYFGSQMPRNMTATQKAAWAKKRYLECAYMAKSYESVFRYAKEEEEAQGGLKSLFGSVG